MRYLKIEVYVTIDWRKFNDWLQVTLAAAQIPHSFKNSDLQLECTKGSKFPLYIEKFQIWA